MSANRKIGLELRNGHDVGRDPRRMTADERTALGHQRMGPLKALRLRCIDYSGGSDAEVRLCTAVQCPAWPFRMGANPWRAPASEAQLAHTRTLLTRRASLAKNQPSHGGPDELQRGAATPVAADMRADAITPALGAKSEDRA
jgi:hypothetical protein